MSQTAGPSRPSSKPQSRVSNFLSPESDGEEEDHVARKSRKSSKINGSSKNRKADGIGGGAGSKRKIRDDDVKGKQRRREIAEELMEIRQELPFYQGRRMILEELTQHDTVIILGETGCGKSTQLSQLLRTHPVSLDYFSPLSAPTPSGHPVKDRYKRGPSIAITQPRRLPAISLATRVAAEMGCQLGGEVGYSVRYEEACGRGTKLRYMTEGVLMRELANSEQKEEERSHLPSPPLSDAPKNGGDESLNLLLKYDVIIIDEAHERTLNTDFLLGSLKRIQRVRKRLASEGSGNGVKELKIVIMSATLDPTKFEKFFDGAPVLFVKGRMYNVHTAHALQPVDDFIEAAAVQTLHIHRAEPNIPGDILIFMPGSEEIENLVALLKRVADEVMPNELQLQVLPLYSSLPPTAQAKIFQPTPPNTRRVIVATNIAETSLTIPGIVFVIDSGYRKEKEYIYRTSGAIEHLKKMEISKASAWQRSGRAGRECEGRCYRLYTEEAFSALPEESTPEIQRCNLASAVLQLVAMNQDPFTFEYIDDPGRDPTFRTLAGLGALNSPTQITQLGKEMLHYPLDPNHARILISSFTLGCPTEIIDILSLIVSGPVFLDRPDSREASAAARTKFIHRDGDHLTGLNVLKAYSEIREQRRDAASDHKGMVGLVGWCKENQVNGKTLQAAIKVRDQLRQLAERFGKDWKVSCGVDTSAVMRALLQGLFMNTAVIQADGSYRQTAGSLQVKIHPSSVLMSKKVPAILYDELTITSAIYARNVSAFEQQWLTEIPWFQQAGTSAPTGPSKTVL